MSYDSKMSEFDTILTSNKIQNSEEIKAKLIALGGTNEAALAQCSFEDLEALGIPLLLAKQIATVFRKNDSGSVDYVSSKKAERMTFEELLARYNPEEDNAISKRLIEIAGSNRFVVFRNGNIVDVDTSAMLLKEIKKGWGERSVVTVDRIIKPIYKVGEMPDNYVDENPLYPGRALRPDGTCDQLNRSWAGVPLRTRQLIYLAVTRSDLRMDSQRAGETLDVALEQDGERRLRERYPNASIEFDKLEKLSQLPSLKIELTRASNTGFPVGKKVQFYVN